MGKVVLGKVAFTPKGEYNPNYYGGYKRLDVVSQGTQSYVSLKNDNNKPLTDTLYWIPFVTLSEGGIKYDYDVIVRPVDGNFSTTEDRSVFASTTDKWGHFMMPENPAYFTDVDVLIDRNLSYSSKWDITYLIPVNAGDRLHVKGWRSGGSANVFGYESSDTISRVLLGEHNIIAPSDGGNEYKYDGEKEAAWNANDKYKYNGKFKTYYISYVNRDIIIPDGINYVRCCFENESYGEGRTNMEITLTKSGNSSGNGNGNGNENNHGGGQDNPVTTTEYILTSDDLENNVYNADGTVHEQGLMLNDEIKTTTNPPYLRIAVPSGNNKHVLSKAIAVKRGDKIKYTGYCGTKYPAVVGYESENTNVPIAKWVTHDNGTSGWECRQLYNPEILLVANSEGKYDNATITINNDSIHYIRFSAYENVKPEYKFVHIKGNAWDDEEIPDPISNPDDELDDNIDDNPVVTDTDVDVTRMYDLNGEELSDNEQTLYNGKFTSECDVNDTNLLWDITGFIPVKAGETYYLSGSVLNDVTMPIVVGYSSTKEKIGPVLEVSDLSPSAIKYDPSCSIRGDLNGDGKVEAAAGKTLLLRHIGEEYDIAYDLNEDGAVDISDLTTFDLITAGDNGNRCKKFADNYNGDFQNQPLTILDTRVKYIRFSARNPENGNNKVLENGSKELKIIRSGQHNQHELTDVTWLYDENGQVRTEPSDAEKYDGKFITTDPKYPGAVREHTYPWYCTTGYIPISVEEVDYIMYSGYPLANNHIAVGFKEIETDDWFEGKSQTEVQNNRVYYGTGLDNGVVVGKNEGREEKTIKFDSKLLYLDSNGNYNGVRYIKFCSICQSPRKEGEEHYISNPMTVELHNPYTYNDNQPIPKLKSTQQLTLKEEIIRDVSEMLDNTSNAILGNSVISRSIGKQTIVSESNVATGDRSIALGTQIVAAGDSSFAAGDSLIVTNAGEAAFGILNESHSTENSDDLDTLFSVGNGKVEEGVVTRSNAFEVMSNGAIYIMLNGNRVLLQSLLAEATVDDNAYAEAPENRRLYARANVQTVEESSDPTYVYLSSMGSFDVLPTLFTVGYQRNHVQVNGKEYFPIDEYNIKGDLYDKIEYIHNGGRPPMMAGFVTLDDNYYFAVTLDKEFDGVYRGTATIPDTDINIEVSIAANKSNRYILATVNETEEENTDNP